MLRGDGLGFPWSQAELLEIAQGADAGGDYSLGPVEIQLWDGAGSPQAGVCNGGAYRQGLNFLRLCVRWSRQKAIGKGGIGQTTAKGEGGALPGVVIIHAPVGILIVVVHRQLSHMIRQGYRQTARRSRLAEEELGQRLAPVRPG